MSEAIPKHITFDDFLQWKPANGCYELHEGVIFEMQPTGKHEEIVEFLAAELTVESRRLQLPDRFPKHALIKPPGKDSGYLPDVLVVDRDALQDEPLWEKSSTITQGKSIPLVVEVVSSNWRDDDLNKLRDYEEMGISEYWIVDYLGLGSSRYIGFPKQATISVYQLVDGEYQVTQFRETDKFESQTFTELDLTAGQIFRGDRE
nr:Uma2 family endonuclease [[Phormidium] sp. ETS-05]